MKSCNSFVVKENKDIKLSNKANAADAKSRAAD